MAFYDIIGPVTNGLVKFKALMALFIMGMFTCEILAYKCKYLRSLTIAFV